MKPESAGKGLDYQLCHYLELQTREWAGSSLPGQGEILTQTHRLPQYPFISDILKTSLTVWNSPSNDEAPIKCPCTEDVPLLKRHLQLELFWKHF